MEHRAILRNNIIRDLSDDYINVLQIIIPENRNKGESSLIKYKTFQQLCETQPYAISLKAEGN